MYPPDFTRNILQKKKWFCYVLHKAALLGLSGVLCERQSGAEKCQKKKPSSAHSDCRRLNLT
jgi:hypothetical protein